MSESLGVVRTDGNPSIADLDDMIQTLNENGFDSDNKTTVGERRNYLAQEWKEDRQTTVSTVLLTYFNSKDVDGTMDQFISSIRAAPALRPDYNEMEVEQPRQSYIPPPPDNIPAWGQPDNDVRERSTSGFGDDIQEATRVVAPLCLLGCCGVGIILAIILIACSVEQIPENTIAVPHNIVECYLDESAKMPGLHTKPTFGEFIMWPTTHTTLTQEVPCLSQDGVVIEITTAFQYTPNTEKVYELTKSYKSYEFFSQVLKLMSRTGVRNACAKFTAMEFQTKRASVQEQMLTSVKDRFEHAKLHAVVLDLQLTSILRPPEYEASVESKEMARNEIERVENLNAQKVTQAQTELLKMGIEANKTLEDARTNASIITTDALAAADIVSGKYNASAALYKEVRASRGLTSEGLLSYISTRLFDEMQLITVGLDAPAKMAYVNLTSS